jgi:hypothetical protein
LTFDNLTFDICISDIVTFHKPIHIATYFSAIRDRLEATIRHSCTRVARLYIFLPIWVHFWGPLRGNCCYILWPFGIFYGYLVYFIAIWYSLPSFGIVFPFFGGLNRKNIWQPCRALECHRCFAAVSAAGWPDWAKFRLSGIVFRCFLIQKSSQKITTFYP